MLTSRVSLIGVADRQHFKLAPYVIPHDTVRAGTAVARLLPEAGLKPQAAPVLYRLRLRHFIVKGSTEEKRLEVQNLKLCAFSI